MITEEVSRLPEGTAGRLRLLRGAIQYREEVEANQVDDALLLGERALAPELVAEQAGGGQLGREPAPGTRAALQRGFSAKEVAGFDGSRASLRGACGEETTCQPGRVHMARRRQVSMNLLN